MKNKKISNHQRFFSPRNKTQNAVTSTVICIKMAASKHAG